MERGYSLVSQQIRGLILDGHLIVPGEDLSIDNKGFFVDKNLEARVQPGSFEPTLGNKVVILDTRGQGLLRPKSNETVRRTFLQIPGLKRPIRDITNGFELKSGHTYLAKLNESIASMGDITLIRSSPKSSTGRLFPITRFVADYNVSVDEVYPHGQGEMDMYLLIQPTDINFIIHPGISLNQLRFFVGDAKLTDSELREEFEKTPLLFARNKKGRGVPVELEPWRIADGLKLTLDTEGKDTRGVFGLRTRKNPDPIDLSRVKYYEAEEWFEPMVAGSRNVIERKGHYLFSSAEIVYVPHHLSAELKRHSREGIEGRTHDAGFVDSGFKGSMVYEVSPDEETEVVVDKMILSSLEFYRTSEIPDKVYGRKIGSNYHLQTGPKVAKQFKPFDFEWAAKNHAKLSRIVLVQDAEILRAFRTIPEGFEPIRKEDMKRFMRIVTDGLFHSRYDCERDEEVLQLIPYAIVFNDKGGVFSYVRTKDKEVYGDVRLFGKHSIGLGGHVTREDAPGYIERCLEREVTEEEAKFKGKIHSPELVGTLFARDKPIDRVHFGLIYAIHTKGDVTPCEESIAYSEFVPIPKIRPDYLGAETETWSRNLIPFLDIIYRASKPRRR